MTITVDEPPEPEITIEPLVAAEEASQPGARLPRAKSEH
jgi:hypothetical protein